MHTKMKENNLAKWIFEAPAIARYILRHLTLQCSFMLHSCWFRWLCAVPIFMGRGRGVFAYLLPNRRCNRTRLCKTPMWNFVRSVLGVRKRTKHPKNIINDNRIRSALSPNKQNDKNYRSIHLFLGSLIWIQIPKMFEHARKKSATSKRKPKWNQEYKWSVSKVAKHATHEGARGDNGRDAWKTENGYDRMRE